jgi:hypothetical protein
MRNSYLQTFSVHDRPVAVEERHTELKRVPFFNAGAALLRRWQMLNGSHLMTVFTAIGEGGKRKLTFSGFQD